MVKPSRSKYFQYIDDEGRQVISSVNSKAGVFAWVPINWYDKIVKVRVFYDDHSDFIFTRVKRNRTRAYITLPSLYTAMKVNISLLPPD